MNAVALPMALPWITFVVVWLLLAPVCVAVQRLCRPSLAALESRQRSAVLLALAVLPVAVAAAVAVLGFAPAIGGLIVDHHCHPSTGCAPHVPILHTAAGHALPFDALLFGGTGFALWLVINRLRRTVTVANALSAIAEATEHERFETIESPERFAYCVGLLGPKILVSRGLIDRLSRTQLRVVLAHEEAHAARRDNLRQWIAALSLWPMPRSWRRPFVHDLTMASEHACDRMAAEREGGAALVIETLAAVHAEPRPARIRADATCARHDAIADRVAALRIEPRLVLSETGLPTLILGAYIACTFAATFVAHHSAELVLGWLG